MTKVIFESMVKMKYVAVAEAQKMLNILAGQLRSDDPEITKKSMIQSWPIKIYKIVRLLMSKAIYITA